MSDLILHSSLPLALPAPLPPPRVAVSVRPATMDDLPFIDDLQKKHTKQVGFMPRAQFEGKIRLEHVLVAWAPRPCLPNTGEAPVPRDERAGYLIGNDQYFKHDDVGIIYQINVAPEFRRSLVAATLLKAQFERSAYGCKLYCCWCAQDIEANRFWESCGFVPLAFRAGSAAKSRVHIFWQKRIRSGDTKTPWWFPSQTSGGSIREDRIVLPIPPGTHWSDAKPLVLPGDPSGEPVKALPARAPRVKAVKGKIEVVKTIKSGGLRMSFARTPEPAPEKPKREPKRKVKNDPRLIAAAREFRDRYLEQVGNGALTLDPSGKYDVSRAIADDATAPSSRSIEVARIVPALPALPAPIAA